MIDSTELEKYISQVIDIAYDYSRTPTYEINILLELYGIAKNLSRLLKTDANGTKQKVNRHIIEVINNFIEHKLLINQKEAHEKTLLFKLDARIHSLEEELDKIRTQFAKIKSEEYLSVHSLMLEFVKSIFKQVQEFMPKPPCAFAVIGLGSLATGLMTPYSDMEYLILTKNYTPENTVYFNNFCQLLELIILCNGEFDAQQSKAYNNFLKDKPRLQQTIKQCRTGFRLDRHKRPFDNNHALWLCANPEYLAAHLPIKIVQKTGNHLTGALFSTVHLIGDEQLNKNYRKRLELFLPSKEFFDCITTRLLPEDIKNNSENLEKLKRCMNDVSMGDSLFDIKRLLNPCLHLVSDLLIMRKIFDQKIQLTSKHLDMLQELSKSPQPYITSNENEQGRRLINTLLSIRQSQLSCQKQAEIKLSFKELKNLLQESKMNVEELYHTMNMFDKIANQHLGAHSKQKLWKLWMLFYWYASKPWIKAVGSLLVLLTISRYILRTYDSYYISWLILTNLRKELWENPELEEQLKLYVSARGGKLPYDTESDQYMELELLEFLGMHPKNFPSGKLGSFIYSMTVNRTASDPLRAMLLLADGGSGKTLLCKYFANSLWHNEYLKELLNSLWSYYFYSSKAMSAMLGVGDNAAFKYYSVLDLYRSLSFKQASLMLQNQILYYFFHLYSQVIGEGDVYIPIYISLANIKNLTNIIDETFNEAAKQQHEVNYLLQGYRYLFSQSNHYLEEIERLKSRHNFLFILDGLDRIDVNYNLYDANRLSELPYSKVIFTCRHEYAIQHPNYLEFIIPEKGTAKDKYKVSYINPFGNREIEIYIKTFIETTHPVGDEEFYHKQIEASNDLKIMAETPLLLNMILTVLSNQAQSKDTHLISAKTSRFSLFQTFNHYLFDKSVNNVKKEFIANSLPAVFVNHILKESFYETSRKSLEKTSKQIAISMYNISRSAIDISELQNSELSFKKNFPKLSTDEIVLMFRVLQMESKKNNFEFLHDTFLEYFVASDMVDVIQNLREMDELLFHPLNRRNLNQSPSIIRFIADKIVEEKHLQDNLWEIIEHSKTNAGISNASANAATLLNSARIPFSYRNLTKASISGADLSNAIMEGVNLHNANLQDTNFQGAWLRNANVSFAKLQGAEFGERPYLMFNESITDIAASVDGRLLAVATLDCKIHLIEINTLQTQSLDLGCKFAWLHTQFNPKKNILAISQSNYDEEASILFWSYDAPSRNTAQYLAKVPNIDSISYSAEGSLLAFSGNSTMAVMNTTSGEIIQHLILEQEDHTKNYIIYKHKSSQIYFSKVNEILLWDTDKNSTEDAIFQCPSRSNSKFSYSSDGKLLACYSYYGNNLQIFNATDHTNIKSINNHGGASETALIFSNDGRAIISPCKYLGLCVWNIANGELMQMFEGHKQSITAIERTEKLIITGSHDKTVRFWNFNPYKFVREDKYSNIIYRIVVNPIKNTIIGCGGEWIYHWDINTGKLVKTFYGHKSDIIALSVNSLGNQLASTSRGMFGSSFIWDLDTGSQHTMGLMMAFSALSFNPVNSNLMLTEDNKLYSYDLVQSKMELRHEFTFPDQDLEVEIKTIKISQDGTKLLAGNRNNLFLLSVDTAEILWREHTDPMPIDCFAFSPLNNRFAYGIASSLFIRDVATQEMSMEATIGETWEYEILALAFSPDGKMVCAAAQSGLYFWLIRNQGPTFIYQGIPKPISDLNFIEFNNRWFLAVAGRDLHYYQVITKDNERTISDIQLLWNSRQNTLNAAGIDFQGADISPINAQLLMQVEAEKRIIRYEAEESLSVPESSSEPMISAGQRPTSWISNIKQGIKEAYQWCYRTISSNHPSAHVSSGLKYSPQKTMITGLAPIPPTINDNKLNKVELNAFQITNKAPNFDETSKTNQNSTYTKQTLIPNSTFLQGISKQDLLGVALPYALHFIKKYSPISLPWNKTQLLDKSQLESLIQYQKKIIKLEDIASFQAQSHAAKSGLFNDKINYIKKNLSNIAQEISIILKNGNCSPADYDRLGTTLEKIQHMSHTLAKSNNALKRIEKMANLKCKRDLARRNKIDDNHHGIQIKHTLIDNKISHQFVNAQITLERESTKVLDNPMNQPFCMCYPDHSLMNNSAVIKLKIGQR